MKPQPQLPKTVSLPLVYRPSPPPPPPRGGSSLNITSRQGFGVALCA